MTPGMLVSATGHVIAALACGYAVLTGYRWVRMRSDALGVILAAGILVRVGLGLALFWVSYLHLPIAQSLQSGRGFWELAVDARHYYDVAVAAVDAHSFRIDPLAPSPFYVWILAMWMRVIGVSPAAAMLLNLGLYVALAVVVVRLSAPTNDWRRDLPCVVFLAAYSFSPVILIHSTQPLKDELFNVLLAAAGFGVLALRRLMHPSSDARQRWRTIAGALAVAVATFGATGIRWYYGFMMWCALALMLAIFAVRGRTTPLPRYLAGSVAVLILAWFGFWAGAGRFYFQAAAIRSPAELSTITQLARVGFLTSGGSTNIVVPLREDPKAGKKRYEDLLQAQRTSPGAQQRAEAELEYMANAASQGNAPSAAAPSMIASATEPVNTSAAPPASTAALPPGSASAVSPAGTSAAPPASTSTSPLAPSSAQPVLPARVADDVEGPARAMPITMREQIKTVATGLAVVFVPVAILQSVSDVRIEGGRGLLSVVDLDTIAMDGASLLILALLWRRRATIGDRLPFVVFGLILAATSAVLLGYVVTNFGTLWRLRSLVAVPLWILVVAISPRPETQRERTGAGVPAVAG